MGHLKLGGGQKSRRANGGVAEDGRAEALAAAFAPVAIDGGLKLAR